MRKFVNGKRYDTASAQEIGSLQTGELTKTLYRKRTGEFFACDGIDIKPLNLREAAELAKKANLPESDYQALFNTANNNQIAQNVPFYVLLPKEVHAKLKAQADKEYMSMKDLTLKILRAYLQNKY